MSDVPTAPPACRAHRHQPGHRRHSHFVRLGLESAGAVRFAATVMTDISCPCSRCWLIPLLQGVAVAYHSTVCTPQCVESAHEFSAGQCYFQRLYEVPTHSTGGVPGQLVANRCRSHSLCKVPACALKYAGQCCHQTHNVICQITKHVM